MWYEFFTYPFPNFKSCNVEVWEWINNCTPHFIMRLSTPCTTVVWVKISAVWLHSCLTTSNIIAWCITIGSYWLLQILRLIGSTAASKLQWHIWNGLRISCRYLDLACGYIYCWTHVAWQGRHMTGKAGVGEKWISRKWLGNETNNYLSMPGLKSIHVNKRCLWSITFQTHWHYH